MTPRGVYQRTDWHRQQLTREKTGIAREGLCDRCGQKTAIYPVIGVKGMSIKPGKKHITLCIDCAKHLHDTGELVETHTEQ